MTASSPEPTPARPVPSAVPSTKARLVLAGDTTAAQFAVGPVYTDKSVEALAASVERAGFATHGTIPVLSKSAFDGFARDTDHE